MPNLNRFFSRNKKVWSSILSPTPQFQDQEEGLGYTL
ncbi:hypothetical protein BH24BAC1_BH24BAC1_23700 [soil metagenome]